LAKKLFRYAAQHHLALLALFIALGGTSYAAMRLPANSVTTREVKNHSLLAKDLKRGQLAGARGRRGVAGPRGSTGPKGPTGDGGPRGTTGPPGQLSPIEAWQPVTFAPCIADPRPAWGDYGYGYSTAAFFRDALGVVHLKGMIAGLLNCIPQELVFSLPAGYRPVQDLTFPAWGPTYGGSGNKEFTRIHVDAHGEVRVRGSSVGGPVPESQDSLDGIAFRAGP